VLSLRCCCSTGGVSLKCYCLIVGVLLVYFRDAAVYFVIMSSGVDVFCGVVLLLFVPSPACCPAQSCCVLFHAPSFYFCGTLPDAQTAEFQSISIFDEVVTVPSQNCTLPPCYYGIGVAANWNQSASYTLVVGNQSAPVYLVDGQPQAGILTINNFDLYMWHMLPGFGAVTINVLTFSGLPVVYGTLNNNNQPSPTNYDFVMAASSSQTVKTVTVNVSANCYRGVSRLVPFGCVAFAFCKRSRSHFGRRCCGPGLNFAERGCCCHSLRRTRCTAPNAAASPCVPSTSKSSAFPT
jgi:hypothetical protein